MEVNKSAVTTVIRKGDRRIILTHTTWHCLVIIITVINFMRCSILNFITQM